MPPPRCIRIKSEPISIVKTITRVCPGSRNTSISAAMPSPVPTTGFHPAWMTQPTQTPPISDGVTCRVAIAMPIASSGGTIDTMPKVSGSTPPPCVEAS